MEPRAKNRNPHKYCGKKIRLAQRPLHLTITSHGLRNTVDSIGISMIMLDHPRQNEREFGESIWIHVRMSLRCELRNCLDAEPISFSTRVPIHRPYCVLWSHDQLPRSILRDSASGVILVH